MDTIILFIIIYLAVGIIGGFLAGLFGIGGGIIFVPVLITTLPYFHGAADSILHVAIGTSLAMVIPGGIAATIKQHHLGNIDWSFLKTWLITILLGAIAGDFIIHYLPSRILQIIFSIFLIVVTISVIFKKPPKEDTAEKTPSLWWRLPVSFITGLTSIFFGIGGGVVTVPFLTALSYPLKKAIAVSSCSSILIGAAGFVGLLILGLSAPDLPRFSFGYFNWFAFVCLAPTTFICAPFGVKFGNKINNHLLKWLYAIFLIIVTIYMLYKTFGGYL